MSESPPRIETSIRNLDVGLKFGELYASVSGGKSDDTNQWLTLKLMKAAAFQTSAFVLFPIALLLGGCGFAQGKKAGEAVLIRHFQTIATNGFDTALTDYSAQFFQKTTKDEWRKALTKINDKLGAYQNHTVTSWRVFKNVGPSSVGTTVSLQCQVNYSKHPATESFTLFKGAGDSDYKIVGHQINSTALLTE
jgi:hypothetical protein